MPVKVPRTTTTPGPFHLEFSVLPWRGRELPRHGIHHECLQSIAQIRGSYPDRYIRQVLPISQLSDFLDLLQEQLDHSLHLCLSQYISLLFPDEVHYSNQEQYGWITLNLVLDRVHRVCHLQERGLGHVDG